MVGIVTVVTVVGVVAVVGVVVVVTVGCVVLRVGLICGCSCCNYMYYTKLQ